MDHYQFSHIRDTQYKNITEQTLNVIKITLHVVLHIFSMLEYGTILTPWQLALSAL